ncbi:serine hydrolase domain-containing protein [Litorilituus lipolyticus]|uniref:Class C beta-lactamase-related serine hydrolase n=1 Tax=Litorilituus lipolyticus TaxID=2491017 RepID=A0A502KVI8_9GAMM|nr:serine hydrolase [Litorilituus lipolyticus]TPH15592.1 class C beta-lactamase-related serine hydrolase [Litorilituus lipolyticus]
MSNAKNQWLNFVCILWACFCLFSCGSDSKSNSPETALEYSYKQPELKGDGWQTAHLSDYSIDVEPYEKLVDKINRNALNYRHIDSVTIIKEEKIIFEQSFRTSLDLADSWANNQDLELHILNSVTKSVTSALIGIAIDQDYIDSVNVKVHDYFQHKLPVDNWHESKGDITLKNWLTMQHGYLWDEWNVSYLNSSNLNSQMNNAIDPMHFLLSRPMASMPGEEFAYSTGVSFGIGRLLEYATEQSVTNFMEQNLFAPLGIEKYTYWSLDNQLHTGSALYLSTRDMAKFGQLFLNKGIWQGEQVISESWVNESTQQHFAAASWGYGYQWWTTQFTVGNDIVSTYYADGYGGQYIFVMPALELVVVFTGRAYQEGDMDEYKVRTIMETDILPTLLINSY